VSDTFKDSLRDLATKQEAQQAEASAVRQREQREATQAQEMKRAVWLGKQSTFTEKVGTVIFPVIADAREALRGKQIVITDSKPDKRGTQRFTCWSQYLPSGEVRQSALFVELEETGSVLIGIEQMSGGFKSDAIDPIRQSIPLGELDRPRFEEILHSYINT
jgi:hypothetical protein